MPTQHRVLPWLARVGLASLVGHVALGSALALAEVAHPAKLSAEALTGVGFTHPDTIVTETPTGNILDLTSLKSSDGKFASGMYAAGAQRFEITEPYGVDEFMFFLEGSVTLTSSDGTVIVVSAGEAVTIPKEFTGVWESDGYRKIWVIYSATGEGL